VIPKVDPLSDAIWKLKPEERRKRALAFPFDQTGEIAGKTGTATNADGKTSAVWLLLFLPGPPEHADKGIVLGFGMGEDSKDHPLGSRGPTGGPGFAEAGARNWVHSAATVLTFVQKAGYYGPDSSSSRSRPAKLPLVSVRRSIEVVLAGLDPSRSARQRCRRLRFAKRRERFGKREK
jgi:hypothetical protein